MRVSAESERNSGMWYAHKIHKYTVCILVLGVLLYYQRVCVVVCIIILASMHMDTATRVLEYQSMHTNSNSTCTSVAIILCIICILRARSTMHTVYFSIHTLSTSFLVLVHAYIVLCILDSSYSRCIEGNSESSSTAGRAAARSERIQQGFYFYFTFYA